MQDPSDRSVPEVTAPTEARIRVRDLLLVVALTAALVLTVRLLVRGEARTTEFVLALLAVQSAIPLAAVHLVIVRGRGVPWSALGLRPATLRWCLGGMLLALATLPLVMAVNYASQHLLAGAPVRNPQIDILAPIGATPLGRAGLLILAGMVAPIVEEIVFRGLFYGWLRARLGAVAGAALSGLGFALAHGVPMLIPALFMQGVILAVVYERSGSLWPSILLHGTFNTVMMLVLYAALAAGISPA